MRGEEFQGLTINDLTTAMHNRLVSHTQMYRRGKEKKRKQKKKNTKEKMETKC